LRLDCDLKNSKNEIRDSQHYNLEIMYHSAGLGLRLRASGWRSTLLLPWHHSSCTGYFRLLGAVTINTVLL